VVEQVGGVVREPGVSPFTKPAYVAEIPGTAPPYVMEALEAVTVSAAWVTSTVPSA
jgi:hypothetical protein